MRCDYCSIGLSKEERAKCKQICDAAGHVLGCKRAEFSMAIAEFRKLIGKRANIIPNVINKHIRRK